MGMTVGIDLGTTNSVVAIKKVNVTTIRNKEGEQLTTSCVTAVPLDNNNNTFKVIVGRDSRNLLKQYPEQTIISVKRLMGRNFEDPEVQHMIQNNMISYKIITDPKEPGAIFIPFGASNNTPEMISSIILDKLIKDSEQELQGEITQAVVTVPAYFSDSQKFATRAACDYVKLKLLRLLSEPTAAALSFGLENIANDDFRTIMVFDLGGGTFDISVLSLAGGSFMEVTKGGDMWLGGDNIDQLIVDHVFNCVQKIANCKPIHELIKQLTQAERARFLVEIKEKAEAAKIALSTKKSATIELFGILKDEHQQLIDIDVTISRAEFNKLIKPIVKQVSFMAQQILHEIRFEPELIDTVLMVGGSSLITAIQDELKHMFGAAKIMLHPRPMLAIAEGAALMAAKMSQSIDAQQDFSITYATAHDYYLQLASGKRHLLVARNTPLPINVTQQLKFAHQDQVIARLRIFNEVGGVLDPVGELWFHKYDKNQRYINDVDELVLNFAVDEDNIITMQANYLDQKLSTGSQIVRGGISSKLYNDLEVALVTIISNNSNINIEHDVLRLSSNVIATILATCDPLTGETNLAQKDKALRQINTLKHCHQKNVAPLTAYEFASFAQKMGALCGVLSPTQNTRLQNILTEFKQALAELENVDQLKQLEQSLDNFYKELPVILDLAIAENAAAFLENSYPIDAKRIRNQAKKFAELYVKQHKDLAEHARLELHQLINSEVAWAEAPTRRFDRDVTL